MTIRFRLLQIGDPERPDQVFPIWEADGQLLIRELEFTFPLDTGRSLDSVTTDDMPGWLREQGHQLTLTPVAQVEHPDPAEAFRLLLEAANRGAVLCEAPAEAAVRSAA
jgi:hypothetical protein